MKEFRKLIQQQFNKMCKTGKLFRSSITAENDREIKIFQKHKERFRSLLFNLK